MGTLDASTVTSGGGMLTPSTSGGLTVGGLTPSTVSVGSPPILTPSTASTNLQPPSTVPAGFRSGICVGDEINAIKTETLDQCRSSCTETCSHFSFCPSSSAVCTGTDHTNSC